MRFAVGDGQFLYSSITGSELAFLGSDAAIPNLALLFEHPLVFPAARRRWAGRADFAPLSPLSPRRAAPGVLLRVEDPATTQRELVAWLRPVSSARRIAQSDAYVVREESGRAGRPVLREPLTRLDLARGRFRAGLAAAALGLWLAIIFGVRQATTATDAAIILLATGCIAAGVVHDTQVRQQERKGLAGRPPSRLSVSV